MADTSWKCTGCYAKNGDEQRYCENCGCQRPEERPEPMAPAASLKPACATCREEKPLRELAPGRDNLERCGPCHIKHLHATMAPPDDPDVVQCKTELRRLLDKVAIQAIRWS